MLPAACDVDEHRLGERAADVVFGEDRDDPADGDVVDVHAARRRAVVR